jgi:hypothetical protein
MVKPRVPKPSVQPGEASLSRIEVRAPEKGVFEVWCWYELADGTSLRLIGHGPTPIEAIGDTQTLVKQQELTLVP